MKSKKYILTLTFLLSIISLYCQEIKKDTSYTVASAYKKYKNKFPQIETVKDKNYKSIKQIDNIVYKKLEHRNLVLNAYFPEDKQNPAVLLIHGGGWKSGDKSHMEPIAKSIAAKGYSCFTIEYRLSDEAIYPAGIYDLKEAIQFIKSNAEKFHVNPNKVAALGCSSGGQMAALIGTTNNNLKFQQTTEYSVSTSVQAIIDLDGILAFKHPKSKEGKVASLWLGGTYEEKPEIWEEASALHHVDKNTPPILFINSQYDRFHAGRDDMINILNQHAIYNQIETFADSPHTFWLFHPWYNKTVNYITAFLDKTLKSN